MREITAVSGLEEIVPLVNSKLEEVISERKTLGLDVIPESKISINLVKPTEITAEAIYSSDGNHEIKIYTLNFLQEKGQASDIIDYFTLAKTILPTSDDALTLSLLKSPTEIIDKFESMLKPEKFDQFKLNLLDLGFSYDQAKKDLIKNSSFVNQQLEDILPKINDLIIDRLGRTLAHEYDHTVLFNSNIFADYKTLEKEKIELSKRFQSDKSQSKELAECSLEYLSETSKILPFLEIRGLLFCSCESLIDCDYNEISKKAFQRFMKYIDDESYFITDILISDAWSKGKMDFATSSYLLRSLYNEKRAFNKNLVTIPDFKDVSIDFVREIYYEKLPFWKNVFAKNAQLACESYSRALKVDPTRLKALSSSEDLFSYAKLLSL